MKNRRNQLPARSGMALMLVIPAVAMAAVLAYAVLANTGTQDQISANAAMLAQADCNAESGINYAMYCLQNPANAPSFVNNSWTTANLPQFTVTMTSLGAGKYSIASTGYGPTSPKITRQMNATVQVNQPVGLPNQAAGFGGFSALGPQTILNVPTGKLIVGGPVTMTSGLSVPGGIIQNASTPAPTSVTSLSSYMLNGVSGTAQLVTGSSISSVPAAAATNPAGVYYYGGTTLTLNGVTINGTLYAPNATVTVAGSIPNTINAPANFPGLIAKKIAINSSGKTLTVNGVVYASAGIIGNGGVGSGITVNGALMIPGAPAIASTLAATITLNYEAQYANVPNFSPTQLPPTSIKVVSFSQ